MGGVIALADSLNNDMLWPQTWKHTVTSCLKHCWLNEIVVKQNSCFKSNTIIFTENKQIYDFIVRPMYTTQNLIRAKILILFAGGPAYLIPKIL